MNKEGINKKRLIICVVVIALLACAGGGALLYDSMTNADPAREEKSYEKMREDVLKEEDELMANDVDFEALREINPDVCAWIRVPGTNVDYPVLNSTEKDDAYYLNYTIEGKAGLPGTIYTEKYNSIDFMDPVTVMYGHTLPEDQTMFTELHKYEEREFFDEHPYFYLYLPDKSLKYQIFSAVAFDDRYILGNYNFAYQKDFDQYIEALNASMTGHVNEAVQVKFGHRVVTLSTCITEFPEQRWLVNGIVVEEKPTP